MRREPMAVVGERRVVIRAGGVSLHARIYENETASAILEILPLTGQASRWGDEIYFSIPLSLVRAPDARDVVEIGELGYWPDGNSFCVFFGETPISRANEIRAASPVNIFGMVTDDPTALASVDDGSRVTVERA
jgi:hypothetical protein